MAKAKPAAAPTPPAETPGQPYYLQKAHVKDYRSVRDAEVEFEPGLNIIIGANGSGKTNFLRAIVEGIDSLAENKAAPGSHFVLGGTKSVEISYLPPNPQAVTGYFSEKPRIQVAVANHSPTEGTDVFEAWRKQALFGDMGLKWPAYWTYFIRHNLPAASLLLLDKDARPKLTSRLDRTPDATGFTLSLVESIRLEAVRQEQVQEAALTTDEAQVIVNERVGEYLDFLNQYLPRHSPVEEARISRFLQVYQDPSQPAITITGLFLEYRVNGSWHQFQELSDGTKRIIYVISELVTPEPANAANRKHLTPPARIILLEEPELGIHPHQLHLLLDLIREVSKKHQVILTTHAPQVLDLLKADELDRILICELKDPKKGTQFRRLTWKQQEKGRRYMTEIGFLSDYWRYSNLEEEDETAE